MVLACPYIHVISYYRMTYLVAIILTTMIGIMSGRTTSSKIETWYATLQKPVWQPPNWLFGPVWTVLYTLMGIALARLWLAPAGRMRTIALILFAVQLVLNALWSPVFFNLEQLGWALVVIVLLVVAIGALMIVSYRVDPIATYLLIPYLVWVLFATALNGSIWQLN